MLLSAYRNSGTVDFSFQCNSNIHQPDQHHFSKDFSRPYNSFLHKLSSKILEDSHLIMKYFKTNYTPSFPKILVMVRKKGALIKK